MELRDYQTDAIERLRQSIRSGNRHPMLVASMGAGKTVMAAEIARNAEAKGLRTLFCVGSIEIASQTITTFDNYGLDVGVIMADHYRTDESRLTQVCTPHSITARMKRQHREWERYPYSIVITDECDIQFKARDQLAALRPEAVHIGLTGSPFSKALGAFYDDLILAVPMSQLIREGYLCPIKAYSHSRPDMKGVKKTGGDYQAEAAAERYDAKLVGDICAEWEKHGKGKPTLMFCCTVAHSKKQVQAFVDRGINAVHVDSYPADGDSVLISQRHASIQEYRDGGIEILSSVNICGRGFDAPETECLILARPSKSRAIAFQQIGRAMRVSPEKSEAIILDHAGLLMTMGFPEDFDFEGFELDDGKKRKEQKAKEKETPLPKPCSACGFLKAAGEHKCPACSYAPERQSKIECEEGDLVELKRGGPTQKEKDEWMRMFKHYEHDKKKKNGHSIYLYREKFGEDPQTKWPRELIAPSKEVLGWITHNNIAKAKRREKHAAAN